MSIFNHFTEIALNNARIWLSKKNNTEITSPKFRLDVVDGLLQNWSCRSPRKRNWMQSCKIPLNPALPIINIDFIHDIQKKKGSRGYCSFCSRTKEQKRSVYWCMQCKVCLCPQCFKGYHNANVYNSN